MQDLLVEDIVLPIGGIADGTVNVQQDSLYLLDGEGTVVSCRSLRQIPATGTNFWRELSAARGEVNALYRTLARGERSMYLMQCGPLPVLVMRYPYRANLSLLAAIPAGELAQALRTPAAYDGHLCRDLQLSPLSVAKRMPYEQEICSKAREWFLPYLRTIARDGSRCEEASTLLQILTARTFRVAHLCGVRAEYDFGGIGYGTVEGVDYALLTAQLFAVMLIAARAARDKYVYLSVERAAGTAPVIYARMCLADATDPLPELTSLRRTAALRGITFEAFFDPARQGLLHLRFSFCSTEISVQQLRASLGF